MTTRQTAPVWVPVIAFEDTGAAPRVGGEVANNHYILLRYTRVCAFQDSHYMTSKDRKMENQDLRRIGVFSCILTFDATNVPLDGTS